MPRGDRTGPAGEGPLTGRKLGYGAGFDSPGYTRGAMGRAGRGFWGRGTGLGRGYGWRSLNRAWRAPEITEDAPDNINQLKSDIQELQSEMSALMARLHLLTGKKEEK
jgi:hypothetical protein